MAELLDEMRIGEKEKNCQQLHSHLDGSQEQQQIESLAAGGFSSESTILHHVGSQGSLGQGAGGSQAEWPSCSSRDGFKGGEQHRDGGEQQQQALARSKIRSKSLKCNKVNSSSLTTNLQH